MKAIEVDNEDGAAYRNLGNSLKAGEDIDVELPEDLRFKWKELLLRAIKVDNEDGAAYYDLGTLLEDG